MIRLLVLVVQMVLSAIMLLATLAFLVITLLLSAAHDALEKLG